MLTTPPCKACLPSDCNGYLEDGNPYAFYSLQQPPFLFVMNCPPGYDCSNVPFLLLDCCGQTILVDLIGIVGLERDQKIAVALERCARMWQFCGYFVPNITPPTRVEMFYNNPAWCEMRCPDTRIFRYQVAAGSVASIDQTLADQRAISIACSLAQARLICLPDMDEHCCVGSAFSHIIRPSGSPPWRFQISAGTLPPGLALALLNLSTDGSPAVNITGTPTTAGNYTFTLRAINRWGNYMDKPYTLPVLDVNPKTLPFSYYGQSYTQALTATGGTAPYQWTLAGPPAAQIPEGLSIGPLTGIVSGTPTPPAGIGVYPFVVVLEDALGHQCQFSCSIEIKAVCNVEATATASCPGDPTKVTTDTIPAGTYCLPPGGSQAVVDAQAREALVNAQAATLAGLGCACVYTVDIVAKTITTTCPIQFQLTRGGVLIPVPNVILVNGGPFDPDAYYFSLTGNHLTGQILFSPNVIGSYFYFNYP